MTGNPIRLREKADALGPQEREAALAVARRALQGARTIRERAVARLTRSGGAREIDREAAVIERQDATIARLKAWEDALTGFDC